MIDIYTQKVLEKIDIAPNLILKKNIRGNKGITAEQLVHALIYTNSIEEAGTLLGYSSNPVKQCIREVLLPYFTNRKSNYAEPASLTKWSTELLLMLNCKKCYKCGVIRSMIEYYSNKANKSSISTECKYCALATSKYRKEYILERTPPWADLEALETFYTNCPEGLHVDHIVPLKGTLVSGFHVLYNLQYLPALDNQSKGNSFKVE